MFKSNLCFFVLTANQSISQLLSWFFVYILLINYFFVALVIYHTKQR